MSTQKSRRFTVARHSEGMVQPSDFRLEEAELAPPSRGQALVKVLYLSLDPTNRVWMQDRDTYLPALKVGDVMRGIAIGEVEASQSPDLRPGDYVSGLLGWQTHAVVDGATLTKLPPPEELPLTAHFGLLGHIGLTAHYGMLEIGKPKPGEIVVVSTTGGAVGSLAAQIARIKGARVVGIAGSEEKCAWVVKELGIDACINYRTEPLEQALAKECPSGVDVYFDNVGGSTLDAVIGKMNNFGRIVACGMISQYNTDAPSFAPKHMLDIVTKRLLMKGFVCLDHLEYAGQAFADLLQWHREGRMKYRVDEVSGLENAPSALTRLFDGSNHGKLLVKVAEA
jgi:NADPH-dependent curcumin reductase